MADDYLALADMLVINDSNNADIEPRDLLDDAPVVAALNGVVASNGHLHKYPRVTQAPVVGFRAENDGREHDSTIRTQITETLKILDASFTVDKDVAESSPLGVEAILRMEAVEHLRAGFFALESQLINGQAEGSATGFEGLADFTDLLANANTISAGGATALTSVYLIRSGRSDVSVIAGNGGNISIGQSIVQRIAGATVGHLPAYFTPISAYMGLQLGSTYSVVRIANIAAATQVLTDDLLYSALAEFPAARRPNMIVMNRRSVFQLRNDRSATNVTGAPAPIPTELEGIPIIVTDAIGIAETAVV